MKRGRAAVVVLGDLGRSPRMQYHALSLANQTGLEVDVLGYGGSDPHRALLDNPSIHIHKMKQTLQWCFPKALHILMLPLKALIQFVTLLWLVCFKIPSPDVFIVQVSSCSSIPCLLIVVVVILLARIEMHYGRMAHGSLCVTKAMQHELAQNWGIRATVLYDQPPEFFYPATLQQKHELFCRLQKEINNPPHGVQDCVSAANPDAVCEVGVPEVLSSKVPNSLLTRTIFTTKNDDGIYLNKNRPALVVSSTSWYSYVEVTMIEHRCINRTPDENFGMLLEAAVMYDRHVAAFLNEHDSVESEEVWTDISKGKEYLYPRLLFIITGKGPERAHYEKKIRKLNLKRVAFRTMWLSVEDYPLLLGSAHLGVCSHTSSSGLDLPMKMLFKGFPESCNDLTSLRNGALATGSSAKWTTEWRDHAMPLITRSSASRKTEPDVQLAPGIFCFSCGCMIADLELQGLVVSELVVGIHQMATYVDFQLPVETGRKEKSTAGLLC